MNGSEFENQDEPLNGDSIEVDLDVNESADRAPVDAPDGENPANFFSSAADLDALAEIPCDAVEPALKRLGPPPFARKGFPIMGLMATIYDHVAERVGSGER